MNAEMLILLGLIAGLSVAEIAAEIAALALLPLAKHAARFTVNEVAKRVPSLHIATVMAIHAARFRLARMRGLRDITISTCLLRVGGETEEWPDVETLLHAPSVNCDLTPLCFRGDVSVRLPLASLAPVIDMRPGDILEIRGLGLRGEPWARVFRISDDIELPLRSPKPQPISIANSQLIRDGQFVAEIGAIARTWAPTLKDLKRVVPFVVRDASRVKRTTYEQLFLGNGDGKGKGTDQNIVVHALATDLMVDTIHVQLTTNG